MTALLELSQIFGFVTAIALPLIPFAWWAVGLAVTDMEVSK